MSKTALSLRLCDALGKLKQRIRASRRIAWKPWAYSVNNAWKCVTSLCCKIILLLCRHKTL